MEMTVWPANQDPFQVTFTPFLLHPPDQLCLKSLQPKILMTTWPRPPISFPFDEL